MSILPLYYTLINCFSSSLDYWALGALKLSYVNKNSYFILEFALLMWFVNFLIAISIKPENMQIRSVYGTKDAAKNFGGQ